jgi:hypothetical protein
VRDEGGRSSEGRSELREAGSGARGTCLRSNSSAETGTGMGEGACKVTAGCAARCSRGEMGVTAALLLLSDCCSREVMLPSVLLSEVNKTPALRGGSTADWDRRSSKMVASASSSSSGSLLEEIRGSLVSEMLLGTLALTLAAGAASVLLLWLPAEDAMERPVVVVVAWEVPLLRRRSFWRTLMSFALRSISRSRGRSRGRPACSAAWAFLAAVASRTVD